MPPRNLKYAQLTFWPLLGSGKRALLMEIKGKLSRSSTESWFCPASSNVLTGVLTPNELLWQ